MVDVNVTRRSNGVLESRGRAPKDGGVHQGRGTSAEQCGGTPALRHALIAGGYEESVDAGDLAVEVARVQAYVPDDLVDSAQVGHRELRRAERGAQCRVLQL